MARNPKATLNIEPANIEAAANRRLLILAQGLGAGFTSGEVYTDIDASTDIATLLGAGSHAYLMSKALIDFYDWIGLTVPFDVLPVADNGSAVQAAGSVAVTGAATESGTVKVVVGTREGVNNQIIEHNTYTVAITNADANTTIADAIKAAIDADSNALVTTASSTGTVTLTAKNGGTVGNEISIEVIGAVAGVGFTLTAMTGGATDPVITTALSNIEDERYDIVCAYPFVADVKGSLENKFNVVNNILDGISMSSKTDTYSDFVTATTGILAPEVNNSQTTVLFCNKTVDKDAKKGSALEVFDPVIATIFAACRSSRFVQNALISNFMQAGNTRGGTGMSTIPYFNMLFPMFPIIPVGENFGSGEIDRLEQLGGSYFEMSDDRANVLSGQVETLAYKADNVTATGATYRFLNNSDALTTARGYIFANLKIDFAQSRLIDGDLPKNGVGVTANQPIIEAAFKKYWTTLVDEGVLQGGSENEQAFDESLDVNLDTVNGRVFGSFSLRIASQVRSFDFDIKTQL